MISSIDMYNLLREKIGDQQAKLLTDYVEQCTVESFEKERGYLATKIDIAGVKTDIAEIKAELKTEISAAKTEMLKWMLMLFMPFYVGMIVFLIKLFWN